MNQDLKNITSSHLNGGHYSNNMAQIELTQEVVLFSDEETIDTQTVVIDTEDELEHWIIVSHCGTELSMSIRNWHKLVQMVESAKSKINE